MKSVPAMPPRMLPNELSPSRGEADISNLRHNDLVEGVARNRPGEPPLHSGEAILTPTGTRTTSSLSTPIKVSTTKATMPGDDSDRRVFNKPEMDYSGILITRVEGKGFEGINIEFK